MGAAGWHVGWLYQQVATQVLVGQLVGQPDEVVIILNAGRALPCVKIDEKGCSVAGREHGHPVADCHSAFWVSGADRELAGDRRQPAHHAVLGQKDATALGPNAVLPKDGQRLIVREFDPHVA